MKRAWGSMEKLLEGVLRRGSTMKFGGPSRGGLGSIETLGGLSGGGSTKTVCTKATGVITVDPTLLRQ